MKFFLWTFSGGFLIFVSAFDAPTLANDHMDLSTVCNMFDLWISASILFKPNQVGRTASLIFFEYNDGEKQSMLTHNTVKLSFWKKKMCLL